ncbi:centriolin isoform X1 [Physeter macrocephalus]|uniref:Centriolin n=2 Tax=Physeter macrocephalus TaxID=9755 RepID=A0A455BK73_PHYMC|nr:centriolin isoform X1 [Physeter catodon]XP_028349375.1 centriolin isoform X1 [Physeter catodon]XP_054942971.1 centriolin isoform X1 [Physeter catodon]|eukprot:XP_028349374.1 centriolin isoform X1 [Physeter catodon]
MPGFILAMKKGPQQKISKAKMPPSSHFPSPSSLTSNMRSRSLSPLSGSETLPFHSGRQWYEQVEIISENTMLLDYQDHQEADSHEGVRYITEALVKKLTKQDNLALVKSLNLSLSKDGGKKFRYIENLEKCVKLEILNLSHNLIGKIEKVDKLLKLRELNLSYNKICKIEGIENMHNLQKLNLAGNEIEHIPVWLGKKLKCLRALNLKGNKISSLQDVSKLKPLQDLTSMILAENPVVTLPHYLQFTIFHLRSLESLEGQPVTTQDRQEAFERFSLEEVERLERDLEKKVMETEELKSKQTRFLEEIKNQDKLNRSLKEEAMLQKQSCEELESNLNTKNELPLFWFLADHFLLTLYSSLKLRQKTMELTRACQKQYELEQELAFYKIDAKFEPLNYYPSEHVDIDKAPDESPYIGKSRYKRNMFATESYITDNAQLIEIKRMDPDEGEQLRNEHVNLRAHTPLDTQLEDKENKISAAQARLSELHDEIEKAEQQILRATEEFKQLEEAIQLKKISEAEKDFLFKQLSGRIQLLNKLRQEALDLEMQMEKQRGEIAAKQKEIKDLQIGIDSLDSKDPKHCHMKAQKRGKEQQLDIMNKQYKQLESRLDEILSRIAKETEEIKDLEQQLTEGQIAANEALKKDLEGVISGLQEYLGTVKGQATQAQNECRRLQDEKETLLQRLTEVKQERDQLEIVALDAENMRKELAELESALQEQHEVNASLQQTQGDLSAYEAELEAQLKKKDAEATQLKEELEKLTRLSQLEQSAVQTELEKEKQALKNALGKAQLSEEKEQENSELRTQLKQLQDDNNLLKQQLKDFQNHLNHVVDGLIRPEEVAARVDELRRKLKSGAGEMRIHSPSDVLGKSLADLQKQFSEILTRSQWEKEEAQVRERKLQEEVALHQEKLASGQEEFRQACERALEARINVDKRQHKARIQQLENEIHYLQDNLKSMEEIQGLTDLQLQEADEEKERILAQLQELEKKKKLEDAKSQAQFLGLDKELKKLKKAVAASDKLATAELTTAKDQLKSLHGTVMKINQERTEELQETERFSRKAAQAARDLTRAEAEIELLQNLLRDKEEQFRIEMEKVEVGTRGANSQVLEIEKLNETMERQRKEIARLRNLLDLTGADNRGGFENVLEEIAELRREVSYQNDYISSMADPFKRRGYWYFMPPPSSSKVSSHSSQATKDSGVGLKYAASTPVRKPWQDGKEGSVPPPASGYWVYSPIRSGLHKSCSNRDADSGGDSQEESELDDQEDRPFVPPPGYMMYTVFPDGSPVPQGMALYAPPPPLPNNSRPLTPGTVVYGPPPAGAPIVYGPPPPNFSIPLIPMGVLHCNVPEHHNLENEVSRLEDIIQHLKSKKQEQWMRVSKQQCEKEIEELHHNTDDLLQEKRDLEHEVEELHRTIQKHQQRKDFIDGNVESLMNELEIEKSLRHHEDIVDEIECIEKTLLKRRAELREADQLLAEAESELSHTTEKTKNAVEKFTDAKRDLLQTEKDAEELERRAQETAVNLVKADQQLRLLQADTKDLEQHKIEQEEILKEINKVVAAKDSEFQCLTKKTEKLTEELQKLQKDIETAERTEDHHLQVLRESETLLQAKRAELEKLKSQVTGQQQEMAVLDRQLGHKKEELHLLQGSMVQARADLQEALRLGETEVAEKCSHIRELKSLLEELSFQKGELNVQISEKKNQLSLTKQEIEKEEENLQVVLGQMSKHKTELKNILDMLQLENNELQGLKLQHDQKVSELEKAQVEVLEEKLELDSLQQTALRQKGEMEWQKQLLERDKQEIERITAETRALQLCVESLCKQKEDLEEKCDGWEKKLAQTKRVLAATEENSRTKQSDLEKLEVDVRKLQQELDQLNRNKLSLHKDIAAMQQQLQEKREAVNSLQEELADVQDHLNLAKQDLLHTTKRQDVLLSEQTRLQEDIREQVKKLEVCRKEEETKQQQLQVFQNEVEENKAKLAQQETMLQRLQKERESEEEKLEAGRVTLKEQRQQLEKETAGQRSRLGRVLAKVLVAEERIRTLQEEERWGETLEKALSQTQQQLSERERQLLEKSGELLALQKETDSVRADFSLLRNQYLTERKQAEKQVAGLKEALKIQRSQLEKNLLEQKQENSCMQKEMATIEQVAQDNHERARRLMKELSQMQQEYAELKTQMENQKDLERRQMEIGEAMRTLKSEVKDEIRTSLKNLNQFLPEVPADLEAVLERNENLGGLESLKENFPFPVSERPSPFEEKLNFSHVHIMDEHWRGEALREKLRHREDRLKAQLRHCMSKQAEVLSKGKRQTEGTLHSLRRQVDALGELVTSTSVDSTSSPGLSQLESSLAEDSRLGPSQSSFQVLQGPSQSLDNYRH